MKSSDMIVTLVTIVPTKYSLVKVKRICDYETFWPVSITFTYLQPINEKVYALCHPDADKVWFL